MQVLLIFPIVLIALYSLTIQDLLILDAWLIIISTVSMTGFICSAMKKSIATGLFSLIFLWARALAMASGVFYAIVMLCFKNNFQN
jgi:hypothetical protein